MGVALQRLLLVVHSFAVISHLEISSVSHNRPLELAYRNGKRTAFQTKRVLLGIQLHVPRENTNVIALIESETFRLGIEFIIFLTPKPRSRKSYPVRPTSRQITPDLRGGGCQAEFTTQRTTTGLPLRYIIFCLPRFCLPNVLRVS